MSNYTRTRTNKKHTPSGTKTCSKCGVRKLALHFRVYDVGGEVVRSSICKMCEGKQQSKRKHKKRAYHLLTDTSYVDNCPYDMKLVAMKISSHNNSLKYRTKYRLEHRMLKSQTVYRKMELQQWECAWCRTRITFDTCEIDHVYPLVKGGLHHIRNIVLSCRSCNQAKNAHTPTKFCERMGFDFLEIIHRIDDINIALEFEGYDVY